MRLAVVGTDTGVGKTVVTAGVTGVLRRDGVDARAVKPYQTGFPPDDDAAFVQAACDDDEAATCLGRLEPPLAPRVAAEREGTTIDYDDLRRRAADALAAPAVGVLEGVGGLRVPLAAEHDVLDLVADCDCEALLVARSGLGTLNHTALSVDALEAAGVPVRGIVLNEWAGETVAERTNPAELERMTGLPVATVPPADIDEPADSVALVDAHLPDPFLPTA
ncbi:dethiobiotin synthase [Haloarchaeobius iranensis]|uniref:ATP-dependent dethiobiotin synthetase BioD n=1 Tax=Haloarchaeobius iranensis TaxID=996166 RepID=A0A1G9Z2Q1_9EURY|nr:dethiobiotin synthase [Haloarchaeobius iranensis]SDN15041.1 dethiobiotin synthetase [Haloarchaeobius iranensis]